MKLQYNNEKLVRGLPDPFLQWLNHIRQLRYEDRPDYALLHKLLKDLFVANGGTAATPYDWEADDEVAKKYSCIPGEGLSETEEKAKVFAKGYERKGGMEEDESSSEEEDEDDDGHIAPRPSVSTKDGNLVHANRSGSEHEHKERRGRCTIL